MDFHNASSFYIKETHKFSIILIHIFEILVFLIIADWLRKWLHYPGAHGNWFMSLMDTFVLTLAEVVMEPEEISFNSVYLILDEIFISIYLFIGPILLIMILIASMDYTQEETNERPNEWMRQV